MKTDGMPRRAAIRAAPFHGGRFHLNASRGAERLRVLLHTVFAASIRKDRIEASIHAWAAADPRAAATVARVDERRLAYVRDLLQAIGHRRAVATHRSALPYRTLIGEFAWRSHGGPALGRKALEQLLHMLLAPA